MYIMCLGGEVMRAFTDVEFYTMIDEILSVDSPSYSMLCTIAEKSLKSSVSRWCAAAPALAGKGFEDDIMQEIYLRLIKTTVSSFLLNKRAEGDVNRDADGYKSWMFTVAQNVFRDYAKKVRGLSARTRGFEEGEEASIKDDTDAFSEVDSERQERLSEAFFVVLESGASPHIVLTWLAQFLIVLKKDVTKIESNSLISEAFDNLTLNEMKEIIEASARSIPWLRIEKTRLSVIEEELSKPYRDGRAYGEVRYGELYMKKGKKATISDWVNRMNSLIKRAMSA